MFGSDNIFSERLRRGRALFGGRRKGPVFMEKINPRPLYNFIDAHGIPTELLWRASMFSAFTCPVRATLFLPHCFPSFRMAEFTKDPVMQSWKPLRTLEKSESAPGRKSSGRRFPLLIAIFFAGDLRQSRSPEDIRPFSVIQFIGENGGNGPSGKNSCIHAGISDASPG